MLQSQKSRRVKGPNYYGSLLNELIDRECSRQMDCINIDCCILKVRLKRIRFIESKMDLEPFPNSEYRVFLTLWNHLKNAKDWKFEFYVVSGNPPYKQVIIEEFPNGTPKILSHDDLIAWLNFEKEIS